MTTRVTIANNGPDHVKIEVQGREHGRFTQGEERYVSPNTFVELYVHDTQSLQVSEVKAVEENVPE